MDGYTQLISAVERTPLVRANVLFVQPTGVVVATADRDSLECDVVDSDSNSCLTQGDLVLVCVPHDPAERGVVLGRLRVTVQPEVDPGGQEELIIEATKSLTLKCGAGSITIRADGKILIKGKDLVSHAQRLNRIKGGAVQIN